MIGIYGTMGPSCEDQATLEAMLRHGMTGMRINLSHASPEICLQRVSTYRSACEAVQVPCEIVLDLKGPEQRIGWLKKSLFLSVGDELILKSKNKRDTLPVLSVPPAVVNAVEAGDRLLLHDGIVTIEVIGELEPECPPDDAAVQAAPTESGSGTETADTGCLQPDAEPGAQVSPRRRFLCRTVCGGKVSSQQSVKIENKELDGPVLSPTDLQAMDMANELGISGVMLSFVRSREDVLNARKELQSRGLNVRIFSKIETRSGLEHLIEIMDVSDVIIIARGDLGNAVPLYQLPGVQKRIASVCRDSGTPFMVATQMLQSMTARAVPYRAEVLDIYNAVLDGADYLMVTGETAVGKFPVQVIDMLAKTAREAEKDMEEQAAHR